MVMVMMVRAGEDRHRHHYHGDESSGKNFFMGGIIAMLLWAFDSPKAKRTMLGNRKSTAQKPERLHDER